MLKKAQGETEANQKCWRCKMKKDIKKEEIKTHEKPSQSERVFTEWQSPLRDWLRPVSEWQRPMADWQRPLLSWYVSDDTKVTMNQLALGPDSRKARQRSGRGEGLEETVMM